MFYGTIAEFCTSKECPTMACGPGVDYAWTDAQKRTSKVPAPLYVDYTTTWIQGAFDDPSQFPTKSGQSFPKDHMVTLKNIFKHLFRVLAHLYYCHYTHFLHLHQESHLNTMLAHFVCYCKTFDLIEKKEMDVLKTLITEFENQQLC
ncbi:Maintenance of ploidy protein mob2 [Coelomomyces lativittatus]|nr:Maintenance of ploidy protein mob2 [Coelomomyces lativittatus]KAJ1504581.1 Maintenance of ploidy protein mob2 [Coelomomyces lativittatus]